MLSLWISSEAQIRNPILAALYIYTFMNGLGSFTMTLNLPFSGFDLVVILEKTLIYRCLTAMFFTPSHLHQCSTCMRKCATVRLARLTSSRSMRARFEQIGGRCKLVEEDQVRSCSLEEVTLGSGSHGRDWRHGAWHSTFSMSCWEGGSLKKGDDMDTLIRSHIMSSLEGCYLVYASLPGSVPGSSLHAN